MPDRHVQLTTRARSLAKRFVWKPPPSLWRFHCSAAKMGRSQTCVHRCKNMNVNQVLQVPCWGQSNGGRAGSNISSLVVSKGSGKSLRWSQPVGYGGRFRAELQNFRTSDAHRVPSFLFFFFFGGGKPTSSSLHRRAKRLLCQHSRLLQSAFKALRLPTSSTPGQQTQGQRDTFHTLVALRRIIRDGTPVCHMALCMNPKLT